MDKIEQQQKDLSIAVAHLQSEVDALREKLDEFKQEDLKELKVLVSSHENYISNFNGKLAVLVAVLSLVTPLLTALLLTWMQGK